MRLDGDIIGGHGEFIASNRHAAADNLPFLEHISTVRSGAQGDFCPCLGGGGACASCTVVVILKGDGIGRLRGRLKMRLDGDIIGGHGEFIASNRHAAADNLPFLEHIAAVWAGAQGDFCTGLSGGWAGASRAVAVILDGDGVGCRGGNTLIDSDGVVFGCFTILSRYG